MPQTTVRFFCEADGSIPVEDWLRELRRSNERAFKRCYSKIARLRLFGHELRRPDADMLRDGIYELRAREGHVNYRVLYFFHGRDVAVLGHALIKSDSVPAIEIERALQRKKLVEKAPTRHLAAKEV
jgi:phage-related protein